MSFSGFPEFNRIFLTSNFKKENRNIRNKQPKQIETGLNEFLPWQFHSRLRQAAG